MVLHQGDPAANGRVTPRDSTQDGGVTPPGFFSQGEHSTPDSAETRA